MKNFDKANYVIEITDEKVIKSINKRLGRIEFAQSLFTLSTIVFVAFVGYGTVGIMKKNREDKEKSKVTSDFKYRIYNETEDTETRNDI